MEVSVMRSAVSVDSPRGSEEWGREGELSL